MKKKLLVILTAFTLVVGLTSCATETKDVPETDTSQTEVTEPVVEEFAAEYELEDTTPDGQPKNDTFIFEGITEDGIITELNFDIIRNRGMEDELSRKNIMGYQMNVSDTLIEKSGEDYNLVKLSAAGYDDAFEGGQFMVIASANNITDETKFEDLSIINLSTQAELEHDQAIAAYGYIAAEAGIEDFSGETLLKDMIAEYDLYKDDSFVEGANRISFAGYNGGRSYGEQMEAIVDHILKEKMTLEEVAEMFKTENQMDQPISERDAVSGATISFIGDFQSMVELAINGIVFEGAVNHTVLDGMTNVEVATRGFGGVIETEFIFDEEGKIVEITVVDSQETVDIGAVLTAADSEFITSLIEGQDKIDDIEAVTGATVTSDALVKAVKFAVEYYNSL